MPIIFEKFIPKRRNHNPRSEAPARPRARSSVAINVSVQSPSSYQLQPPTLDTPPGLHGTSRFFITITKSKSLVDEADSVRGLRSGGRESGLKERSDSVAVPTYWRDPHEEFRRSMKEMVRARLQQNLAVDLDYLVELVMRHADMNEKEARKYILKAFVDVILPLRQCHGDVPARSRKNKATRVHTVRTKK